MKSETPLGNFPRRPESKMNQKSVYLPAVLDFLAFGGKHEKFK
jgi:hypothetical protein